MDRRTFLSSVLVGLIAERPWAASARIDASSPWPAGKSGAVSLTYDDGLDSQLDLAVPALNQRGLRATFFVTMSNIEKRMTEWEGIVAQGHELANHTVHHPCDLQRFTPRGFFEREVAPMEAWLDEVEPGRPPSLAYPCDVTNLGRGDANRQARRYDRLLAQAGIVAARTSEGEPNRPATALRRPHRVQALAVGYDAPTPEAVTAYLERAASQRAWAVLVFHGIAAAPAEEGEIREAMHARILDSVRNLPLWCAPFGQVFERLSTRGSSVLNSRRTTE